MLTESGRRRAGRAWLVAAAAAGIVAIAATACRKDSLVFRNAPVVIISIDTLRADHLPAYGYRGVETPSLDALRKDSILFENAYAHVPLTLPSHTSLFTGLLPPQNGVRDNVGYNLGDGMATLAGFLGEAGYATGGAVSAIVLSHATGVSRGFDFWEDNVEPTQINQSLSRIQRNGGETADLLRDWIDGRDGKPFLAFLHLFEPHTPYEPPEPYRSRYPTSPYDGEIARSDELVGRFLGFLKERGIYDRALIVLLSDHGEGLGDHGEDEHGVLLYREAIHVPLMVKFPKSRRAAEAVKTPVGLVDLFPTIASVLGLEAPPGLAGTSLAAIAAANESPSRRIYGETLFPRLHLGWSDLASLTDSQFQYIESTRPELYDFRADPKETNDLAGGLPPAFRSMRAELERMPRPLQPPGLSDPEQVKKLAALGYIGATSADLSRKDLPAPRDRVGAVRQLKQGFGHLQAARFDAAVPVFRELLRENPGMTDVWQLLSDAYLKLGRHPEALAALQQAAKLSPGNPQVLIALTDYYLITGDFAEAKKHALAVGESAGANAHENLARIAIFEGDLETAEKESRIVLQKSPGRRIPHLILGRVLHDRRDCPGALAELELARKPRGEYAVALQNLSFLRGDCLARLGREAEAEQAFREEIRLFPDSTQARASLAILFASQGREADARNTLTELVRQVRTPEGYFAAIRTYEVLGDPGAARALRAEAQRLFPGAKDLTRRET